MKQWSTRELRYLEGHAGDGAKQVAKDLGRSIDSVKHMARKCGLSLRKRRQCPRCGQWTFRPLNRVNGWCIECTKELHMADLAEQANAMKEEAIREKRNDRQRQRYYSQKSRAKKAAKKGRPVDGPERGWVIPGRPALCRGGPGAAAGSAAGSPGRRARRGAGGEGPAPGAPGRERPPGGPG